MDKPKRGRPKKVKVIKPIDIIKIEDSEVSEPISLPEELIPEPTIPLVRPKVKREFDRNIVNLGFAITSLVIGGFMGYLWFNFMQKNYVVALLTIAGIVLAVYFGKKYINLRGFNNETVILDSPQVKNKKRQYNSLNIFPNKVEFCDMAKPMGQPWKCHNDGKNYFVHIWNVEKGELQEFTLPDQQYYIPEVFAGRVLELPAHRRIFRRKQTMLEQLSPAMALGGIVIFSIIMIVTLG